MPSCVLRTQNMSQISVADGRSLPFPCEGNIRLAVRNKDYALGPVMLHLEGWQAIPAWYVPVATEQVRRVNSRNPVIRKERAEVPHLLGRESCSDQRLQGEIVVLDSRPHDPAVTGRCS